jgi:hypothetical protein
MSNPTRFTSGVSTAYSGEVFYSYPYPDPFHTASLQNLGSTSYMNDFNTLIGTDYIITGTSSTFALTDGIGGQAILTPGGTTTATSTYKRGSSFQFVEGNRFWFTTRFQASAVSGTKSFYVGLQAGSATTDGIWFAKAASSTSVNLVSTVNSTATTLVTGVTTATAGAWIEVGFYFDGTDLLVYNNNQMIARLTSPTIGASNAGLTNALITPVLQITPTATDTLTVDYIGTAQELSR